MQKEAVWERGPHMVMMMGWTYGALAYRPDGYQFTVTHIGSGWKIRSFETEEEARRFCEALGTHPAWSEVKCSGVECVSFPKELTEAINRVWKEIDEDAESELSF